MVVGGEGFPFQKQACNTADSWFMSGRRLCLDRLTSLSAHVNSIITEVHVGYSHGIVSAATLINGSLMLLSSPPTPQTNSLNIRFRTDAAQHLHDRAALMGTLLHSVSQHITNATVWWHTYVLRPCGKVRPELVCIVQSGPWTFCGLFFLQKGRKNIQIAQKETVMQPQTWRYSGCHAELAVTVWTAGYTCQSLLYDIALKDLSLSSPFCYVQELEVMKYFYSLISWMSTLAVKWIILKSPFWKADTERVFLFFVITHILQ